jgi:hypothetical protein
MYDEVLGVRNGDANGVAHFSARSDSGSLFTIEPCDHDACTVRVDGMADCGARACPSGGTGGTTLSLDEDLQRRTRRATCRHCGHTWII